MTFRTVVTHGDALCAEAEVTVAAVNRDGRPMRLPADIVEKAKAD